MSKTREDQKSVEQIKIRREIDPPLLKSIRWLFPKLEKYAPFLADLLFRQLFFTPLRVSEPIKEKEVREKGKELLIDIAGKKVATYSWGEGAETVLLCHGWMGRAGMLREFIKPLNEVGYKVVSFDGPAHGRSLGIRSNILEFEGVVKSLDEIHGPFKAIIGHSFGGVVGLFSIYHGIECKKLVMIGSPTQGDEILKQYLKRVNGSFVRATNFKRWLLEKRNYDFIEYDSVHLIQKIDKPLELFIVHDINDKEVLIDDPRELGKVYPQAKVLETEGLGHNRILRDKKVVEKVVDFVDQK